MSLLKNLTTAHKLAPRISGLQFNPIRHCCKKEKPCGAPPMPRITLNDGNCVPQVGIGTWGSEPKSVGAAISHAIKVGYRHIDCAHLYGNEKEIGAAINEKIKDNTVKREDLFITGKLWNTFHHPSAVKKACEISLKNLNLKYLDLFLIHWPTGFRESWEETFPSNCAKKLVFSNVHYTDTWGAMECLAETGLVKSIGVSNFNICQLEKLLCAAQKPPAMLQIECHPYLNQTELREYAKSKDIAITAYSPLGSPTNPWKKKGDPVILEDVAIRGIAEKYKKTPAQILIRFQMELGNVAIPKAMIKEQIASNLDVLNFSLCEEDVEKILQLHKNRRLVWLSEAVDHPFYPFNIEG